MFCKHLTAYQQVLAAGHSLEGKDSAYSLKNKDYPRLPLFTRKGPASSTALLNPLFWLMLQSLVCQCGGVCSNLYCSIDNMKDLASLLYPASSVALGGGCPALRVVPNISRNLVAYLVVTQYIYGTVHLLDCGYPADVHLRDICPQYICGIVVTQYICGTAGTCAAGLGEAHTDIVLKILTLATCVA